MHSPAWGWRRTRVMSAHGRQTAIGRGDATLMSSTEPSVTHIHTPSKFHRLALQRAKLAPLVSESWRGFRVGHSRQCRGRAAALALCGDAWRRYLAGDVGPAAACGLSCLRSCRAGARRDEGCRDDLASGRPARRPARSHQKDIAERARDISFSIEAVARRHGLSPRYIRRLFEARARPSPNMPSSSGCSGPIAC